MKFFETLEGIKIGSISLATILSALLVLIACYICIRIIKNILVRALKRSRIEKGVKTFILQGSNAILWFVAVIITAGSLGIDTTSLVAVLSVAGLALSLAVQGLMSNLFSGVTILTTKPFLAGDFVEINGMAGTVSSIGLFNTCLRTVDNKAVFIPNSDITAAKVVNHSYNELRRVDLTFGVSYDAPTEIVKDALLAAAAAIDCALDTPAPAAALAAYKDSNIEYSLKVWCRNEDYWTLYNALNERVREELKKVGAEMSFPCINVTMVEKKS